MVRELGYSTETQRAVRICGLLHDVGKIAVPDAILRKPGRLNDDEFQIMQQHPVFGALIVKDVPNLNEVLGGIRHHHERYDGKGYPDKLMAEDIPMMGRLLAVPDCFSAMTTDRPYRKALTWSEALTEIERGKGTQFDPVMVDAFLEVIARIVADSSSHSLDPEGTRHSVVQLGHAAENDGQEPGAEAEQEDGEGVVRPRSVMDAATDEDSEGIAHTNGAVSMAS
jgi:HD-GYP domain-containing protein (c-di-GMP phosphodiesterase class II)